MILRQHDFRRAFATVLVVVCPSGHVAYRAVLNDSLMRAKSNVQLSIPSHGHDGELSHSTLKILVLMVPLIQSTW